MSVTQADQLEPSGSARLDLDRYSYLSRCVVTGRTTIADISITYEVVVGDWIVWYRTGVFGQDEAHRAAGAAFRALAQEQETVMHDWADRIVAARQVTAP